MVNANNVPEWILSLDLDEVEFIRRFLISSGSLKEMAEFYGVSYPTVRIRLDRLIQKIELTKEVDESFIKLVKQLAIEERLSLSDATLIINKYKQERNGGD